MCSSDLAPNEAFYGAMDITVNFRRGGRISRELNKVIPFFNVSVQGIDKFARWIIADEVRDKATRKKVVRSRAIGYIAVMAALAAIVYALNNRDDDDEKNYEQLSNYLKNSFWNIPIGDGQYFSIPKPRELGILSSFFETSMEYSIGDNDHAFDDFYKYMADNGLPKIASDLAQIGQNGVIETASSIIGQFGIIGVMSYLVANRDFLGNPIVSAGMQNLEPKDQYTSRTSKIAYWIGQAFDVSPIEVDYFFQQVLGGWWKTQKALFPVGGENVDYTLGVRNTYIKDNQRSNDLVDWMYDKADKSAKASNSDPDNIKKAIESKFDSNMTTFYSRYYKLTKDKADTTSRRGARQTVLDMIYEYRKADDNGRMSDIQEEVKKFCEKTSDTSYLPSVMQTEVEDINGEKHKLSDVQYVEYQTDYLRIYWETVEDTLRDADTDKEKQYILKAAAKVSKEQATNRTLSRIGAPYEDQYKGVDIDDTVNFLAKTYDAKTDGGLTQKETADIILELGLDADDIYTLFMSEHSDSKRAEEAQKSGIPADMFVEVISKTDGLKADKDENGKSISGSKKEKVIDELNSVPNMSHEEYLWFMTEFFGYKMD